MQKTILIVDDSAMILRIVGQILKEAGYNILLADSGKTGCDLAKRHFPDLIVMDIEMPQMNGIEATEKIRSNSETAHIPIMIFTSLGSEEDMSRARAATVQGFLNKPICKEDLVSAIGKILDHS
ncbi:MAG: response regulator [Desulfobulbaceae bacterium]|nr:response regulator [Desulfobulbaceae bacterium]MCK5322940.1 response regulator [Desulfobulbaceae bacterium]MCK5437758.1 response regulator [Desulfobulbaceae bacterium]MCK5543753.1 response regulator [Desulfobulbaceae bacterium]